MEFYNIRCMTIGYYKISFQTIDDSFLPAFTANVWRSVFGMQLKAMSEGKRACPPDLILPREKLYEYFMETPPPEDTKLMRLYPQAPHPYIFACPWRQDSLFLAAGSEYRLPIILFGKANALLPVVILALARAAAGGLGKQRGRMRLNTVEQIMPDTGEGVEIFRYGGTLSPLPPWSPQPPQMPEGGTIQVRLETPLRLSVQKRLITPKRFTSAYPLIMNLIRRASMISAFHNDVLPDFDFRALRQAAQAVRLLKTDLVWKDQFRHSSRTGQRVPLGGVMGTLEMDLSSAPEVWPFLWLGQWLHAGKGTVFGMGRMTISPCA